MEMVGDNLHDASKPGRQITTDAHPAVQMTLQRQKREGRTLVHVANLSGAAQVGYTSFTLPLLETCDVVSLV